MKHTRYVMVCDERGTTAWPSSSRTWAMGGFIAPVACAPSVAAIWDGIREELCGHAEVELKWSHFFPGRHQEGGNPLLSTNSLEWRGLAKWALSTLFDSCDLVPVTTVVRKDKAANEMFLMEKGGRKVLETQTLWLGVVGQYATYLKHHDALGEIWFDRLGSHKEEARRQAAWRKLRDGKGAMDALHQETLRRISPELRFCDSREEPLIQVADFVSGVLWAAAEGDEEFLMGAFRECFPWGRDTYTFMFLT